jgi:hypothetical protein
MKPLEIILTVLITITLGLTSFALKWIFDTNAQMAVMGQRMDAIVASTEQDAAQDRQLGMHWKLHGWTRDRINELRTAEGLPLAEMPDLD